MQEDLMQFWGIAVAIFSFLLGINIKDAFEKNVKNPDRFAGISDLLLLVALFGWLLLYLYSTWFETKGMAVTFSEEQLQRLGVNVSFLLMAFALAVFFAIIISYHNNIIVVCIMAILLGIVDTYGNYNIMTGMLTLAAGSAADDPSCVEKIWYYYYLENSHLQRILLYMIIVFVALILSIYREQLTGYLKKDLAFNLPKLMVIGAIVINESIMLSWRVEREDWLARFDSSYYFQWSAHSVLESQELVEGSQRECPVGLMQAKGSARNARSR